MALPFPDEDQDPWYEAFVAFANAIDASLFASREDRNVILHGGGVFLFNSTTGLLTWSSSIDIVDAPTGFLWQVSAGEVSLQDGEWLFVDLPRGLTQNRSLSPQTPASTLPPTDTAFGIALRIGSNIYFRNGRLLAAGSSATVLEFETTAGGGGGGGGGSSLTGQTTTFLSDGDFGYVSGANAWTKAQADSTRAKAVVGGVNTGTPGTMLLPGNPVLNAKFTTVGGAPTPGNQVYLARGADDTNTGAGKLTATAPATVGEYLTVVGICVDAANYASLKTAKIIFHPESPILL